MPAAPAIIEGEGAAARYQYLVKYQELLFGIRPAPAPGIYPGASLEHALSIHIGNDVSVTGEQRFGGTHTGTERYLAFGYAVLAIEFVLFGTERLFRATGAHGTLIHGPARPEEGAGGKLRGTKWTGHETVTTADTGLLAYQNDTVIPLIERIHGADSDARRIGAVHAGYGNGLFTWFTFIKGYHCSSIDADWNMVAFLTGNHAATTVNAAFDIAQKS